LALLCLAAHSPLPAQEDRATVRLFGRAVFRVSSTATQDAATRARTIERRLDAVAQAADAPPPARIERGTTNPEERIITVAGVAVVTVFPSDAEENLVEVDALARQWARAVDEAVQRAAREGVHGWSGFQLRVQGAFRAAFGRLLESAAHLVPGVLAAVGVVLLFWGLASLTRVLLRAITARLIPDDTAASLIWQAGYYTIWIMGVFVAAGALGFEPEHVVTGLGLTSLALGFALKDILSNFVSGILLLLLRPFQLGDQIVVGETEGSVERIELRATQIRTYDGRIVYVPNADIFTSRVTNNTAAPIRRATVEIPLSYDQDFRQASQVLLRAVENSPGVLTDPPASVRFGELGPDEAIVELRFWTDSRRSDFATTMSAVRQGAVQSLKQAGISVPDPNRRNVVLQGTSQPVGL
jgi:small conductance mechanosensitive channel